LSSAVKWVGTNKYNYIAEGKRGKGKGKEVFPFPFYLAKLYMFRFNYAYLLTTTDLIKAITYYHWWPSTAC
jgi:hypothetical protein